MANLPSPTQLSLENQRLTLEHHGQFQDRDFTTEDRATLETLACDYRASLKRHDCARLQRDIGQRLYQWLDRSRWLTDLQPDPRPPWLFEVRTPAEPDADARALLEAPWELLADAKGHLAAHFHRQFAPYRRLGHAGKRWTPSGYRLALVFMAAAPMGQALLDFEAEEAAILAAVGNSEIDLDVEESGNLKQLADLAARAAVIGKAHQPVDVVHLSCHGGFVDKKPYLFLEQETGEAAPVGPVEFLAQSSLKHARLLFVSACHTAEAREEAGQATDSLAHQLLTGGFPAVLGWSGAVSDREASAFAAHLYRDLARHESLEQATAAARFALLNQSNAEKARDWHLARLFLGPEGGGPLVRGNRARRLVDADHGAKEFLDAKRQAVPVARRAEFVGRRRALQSILRMLSQHDHAGVLIHGMGRQGKSSLAARVANRLPHLQPLVVFGRYRGEEVLNAFANAELGRKVNAIVRRYESVVRTDPARLVDALHDLLHGPCERDVPVLLIIDDLEQILAARPHGRHQVRGAVENAALAAILHAFHRHPGPSRLLFTSRYRFALIDRDGTDLAAWLFDLHLPPMDENEQHKQLWQRRKGLEIEPGAPEEDEQRTARCLRVAGGNPGLQELLYRLSRTDPSACDRTLDALEGWLAGRGLEGGGMDEEIRNTLEGLTLEHIHQDILNDEERRRLRESALFTVPVPEGFVGWIEPGAVAPRRLRALGLWDVWPDPVLPRKSAVAINPLTRAVVPHLGDEERVTLAARVIAPLFEHWRDSERPYPIDHELTRLALLAGNAEVTAAAATDATAWLHENWRYREAAVLGRAAVELLQGAGLVPPLMLLRWTGDALTTVGDTPMARRCYRLALELHQAEEAPYNYAALLLSHARLLVNDGEPDEALVQFRLAQQYLPRDQYPREYAVTLGDIAGILVSKGQIDDALALHHEELQVYEALGDQRSRAVTLGNIARIKDQKGQIDDALALHHEELQVYEALGDPRSRAVTLGNIARIKVSKGQIDDALALHHEMLRVFEALGDQRSRAVTLGNIARIKDQKGQIDDALALHHERLRVFEALGDPRSRAVTLGDIARILVSKGQIDDALALHHEELQVYEALGDQRSRAVTLGDIAGIHFTRGELTPAQALCEEKRAVAERLGDVDSTAHARWSLGRIAQRQQEWQEALEHLVAAYQMNLQLGRLDGIVFAGLDLGQLLCAAGDQENGRAILERSRAGLITLGQAEMAAQVAELIEQCG